MKNFKPSTIRMIMLIETGLIIPLLIVIIILLALPHKKEVIQREAKTHRISINDTSVFTIQYGKCLINIFIEDSNNAVKVIPY